jgi:hypothetical protein
MRKFDGVCQQVVNNDFNFVFVAQYEMTI